MAFSDFRRLTKKINSTACLFYIMTLVGSQQSIKPWLKTKVPFLPFPQVPGQTSPQLLPTCLGKDRGPPEGLKNRDLWFHVGGWSKGLGQPFLGYVPAVLHSHLFRSKERAYTVWVWLSIPQMAVIIFLVLDQSFWTDLLESSKQQRSWGSPRMWCRWRTLSFRKCHLFLQVVHLLLLWL